MKLTYSSCRWLPWSGCVFLLVFFATLAGGRRVAWCQDLPGESELPGIAAAPAATTNLPGESTLPVYLQQQRPAGSDEQSLPGNGSANHGVASGGSETAVTTVEPLPGESELPPAQGAADTRPDTQGQGADGQVAQDLRPGGADDPLGLATSMDDRPWLRLVSNSPLDMVRSLVFTPDGQRLSVAGDDKAVLVYARMNLGDAGPVWQHERTIRWQVQRGPRGIIYATDVATGTLAIAGHGAMGSLGEILLVDPATGRVRDLLMDPDNGNRQRITSLAFAPGAQGSRLVAMDMDGRLVAWSRDAATGQWSARKIRDEPDSVLRLRNFRRFHPVVMLDSNTILAPRFADMEAQGPRWQLQRIAWDDPSVAQTIAVQGEYHHHMITAMAVSQSGTIFASADAVGNLYLWETQPRLVRYRLSVMPQGSIAVALAFSTDGQRLLLGTFAGLNQPAEVKWLDVSDRGNPRTLQSFSLPDTCTAVAVSPTGDTLAYASGATVWLRSTQAPYAALRELRSNMRIPQRVAFPTSAPSYQLGIATTGPDGQIDTIFDTETLQLRRPDEIPDTQWQHMPHRLQGWHIARDINAGVESYWLMENNQRRGRVPLDLDRHGAPSAVCWIPSADGSLGYFAVGTAGQSNIHLFAVARSGVCRRVREFRGHSSKVVSLSYSADLRYLASASVDGTVRIWRLDGQQRRQGLGEVVERWGAEFVVENGALFARNVREEGPLHFRGIRSEDRIERLSYIDPSDPQQQLQSVLDPQEMLRLLQEGNRDQMVVFDYRRGATAQKSFQSFPAWQPVASLLLSQDGEWAYWTPHGYYDASFEGHKLFGWQVNRGPAATPDFYLAAQMRNALERPQVMSQLLRAGSVESAFRQAQLAPPSNVQWALRDQTRLAPEITILEPPAGADWSAEPPIIRAAIRVPEGEQLVQPKAFTNGVVASAGQQHGEARLVITSAGRYHEYTYQWHANVPSDPAVAVQVIASTSSEIADMESITVSRPGVQKPQRMKLYIAAAAVDQYRDAQVPRLTSSVDNTQSVIDTLVSLGRPLYDSRTLFLQNDNVTVAAWQVASEQYASELVSQVTPDDLLVIFLSGHGIRDEVTDTYYYLGADARFADVMSRQYEACLSFDQFRVFADVPCRKLVILDTCHSGAVQPLRQRDLKAALRALHDDMILTLTASEGTQEAVEARFARHLLEGLRGVADIQTGDGNNVVSFEELAAYVASAVSAEAAQQGIRQRPMAGPRELLPLARIPMTQTPRTTASYGPARE